MRITQIDHLVLTVRDIKASCNFYTRVLGMKIVTFADNRTALAFGSQKINLHEQGNEFEPKAVNPVPGAIDLCLLTADHQDQIMAHLQQHNVKIIEGPVRRTGATESIMSIYFLDPDGNLLEIATPVNSPGNLRQKSCP
jgi:catechol 2,3-dioxygenase-like lactoylglutathione lyase family enzyme